MSKELMLCLLGFFEMYKHGKCAPYEISFAESDFIDKTIKRLKFELKEQKTHKKESGG